MVTWSELVRRVAKKGYYLYQADQILSDVFTVILEAMAEGEDVRIHGFGTFRVKEFKNRVLQDLKTKETVLLPPYKVPRFEPGSVLKTAVKAGHTGGNGIGVRNIDGE